MSRKACTCRCQPTFHRTENAIRSFTTARVHERELILCGGPQARYALVVLVGDGSAGGDSDDRSWAAQVAIACVVVPPRDLNSSAEVLRQPKDSSNIIATSATVSRKANNDRPFARKGSQASQDYIGVQLLPFSKNPVRWQTARLFSLRCPGMR